MNDVAPFSNSMNIPADPRALQSGLQNMEVEVPGTVGDNLPYMKLDKRSGIYSYGPEDIEVEEDSLWAVNPYTLQHGVIAWGGGKVLGEKMVRFDQPAPDMSQLPDYGANSPWTPQVSVMLACVSGEDTGTQVLYSGTALGLRKAFKQLISAITARLATDQVYYVPVIELDSDTYTHREWGVIRQPIFHIRKWASMEGGFADEKTEAVTDESKKEEPAAEKPDASAEEAAGRPRRRRRAKAS